MTRSRVDVDRLLLRYARLRALLGDPQGPRIEAHLLRWRAVECRSKRCGSRRWRWSHGRTHGWREICARCSRPWRVRQEPGFVALGGGSGATGREELLAELGQLGRLIDAADPLECEAWALHVASGPEGYAEVAQRMRARHDACRHWTWREAMAAARAARRKVAEAVDGRRFRPWLLSAQ